MMRVVGAGSHRLNVLASMKTVCVRASVDIIAAL